MNPEIAAHEARHAAAAVLLGLRCTEARADNPAPDALGYVRIPFDQDDLDQVRRFAISVMAGRADDDTDWPPAWPPNPDSWRADERQLAAAAKVLDLDRGGWDKLIVDTLDLWATRPFDLLEQGLSHVLETGRVLDERAIKEIHELSREVGMEHITVKAAVADIATEEGTFTAVISTSAVDREGDVVLPAAMVKALRGWAATPKLIPLSYNHSTAVEDIVGHVDPGSVEQVGNEVMASGWVDRDTDRGREVWRLMKSGTLGFSFGYLAVDTQMRADGVREIHRLDIFEISATPTPMNANTRVVSTNRPTSTTASARRSRSGCSKSCRHPRARRSTAHSQPPHATAAPSRSAPSRSTDARS